MVKVTETIICQRFVQNAWKKDLCSNCFKSKEDHRLIPEKKISYRWTSHVNNFPQHGILKGRQKNETSKTRNVSFHAEETEIIGFGGEEVSSDDEYYPTVSEGTTTTEMDTEDDKAFRKLTQLNTDFNSVPANLKSDQHQQQTAGVQNKETKDTCGMYSNLKLGKPLLDADGFRQTLHVSVEPFRNSTVVGSVLKKDGVTQSNKMNQEADQTIEKTDSITNNANSTNNKNSDSSANSENSGRISDDCDVKQNSICILANTPDTCKIASACSSSDKENFTGMLNVEVTETINEANVFVKRNVIAPAESKTETEDVVCEKYSTISNVPVVDSLANADARKSKENDVTENMKNAKTVLEPLFRLNCKREDKPKLSIYQSSLIDSKEKRCSMNKDCNPINLPLIMSKELEIELDKPGSRELVGEPDGKADSDDAYDPLKSEETKIVTPPPPPSDSGLHINPQRSFLHATKPKPASKPATLETTPVKILSDDSTENTTPVPQTPKAQGFSSCQNTGSTKRQAPKPPSPKSAPPTPILVKSVRSSMVSAPDDLATSELSAKLESPQVDGTRNSNAHSEYGSSSIRRRLHLEPISRKNRNSVCVSMTPNGTNSLKQNPIHGGFSDTNTDGGDAVSISSSEYAFYEPVNAVRCSRSLSCDSISPTNGLPEKTSKYVGTTIKMKSTLRKFLRFNSKDDEKSESENAAPAPVTPRRRIEIIHPLDLNKSSIEILRPQAVTEPLGSAKKAPESNSAILSTVSPETNYVASSTVRPSKPPPPPRNQSLEQKHHSEISKPARPPPPKSVVYKSTTASKPVLCHSSSNTYENLGESRHNIAPAKPQRASSMRDRARQTPLLKSPEENPSTSEVESEAVPECDRLRLQPNTRQLSDTCDMPSTWSTTCFSETESDHCYQSIIPGIPVNSATNQLPKVKLLDTETRKISVVNNNIEDNYGAIVTANLETLSSLLDQVNQTTFVPRVMKVLQATSPLRFEHFSISEHSRVSIFGWHFYNATFAGQNVVISVSNKQLGPVKSLPQWIILYPLIKFTDVVPSRFIKEDAAGGETNAFVTVWNEERIESISSYCERYNNSTAFNENALLLMQLMNALKLLQACGIEDVSLDEIFICKRELDVESKLVLPPMTVECNNSVQQIDSKRKISLCSCASAVLSVLLPKQRTADIVKNILSDEKAASLSQAKSVAEYWLWGPHDVTLTTDRQNSLQRWLDLERATQLHKLICKRPEQLTLSERCRMIFLVRTNAKSLTEASFLFEKSV